MVDKTAAAPHIVNAGEFMIVCTTTNKEINNIITNDDSFQFNFRKRNQTINTSSGFSGDWLVR